MNIETKSVRGDVTDYIYFGWKHTEDTRVRGGRAGHTEHILARDKDMPNYSLIKALETKYFALKSSIKSYTPIDGGTCFLLFLALFLPGVIYVAYKSIQKSKIDEHNVPIEMEMRKIITEVKELV